MTRKERTAVRALVELGYTARRIARELKLPLVDVAPLVAAEVRKESTLVSELVAKLEELGLTDDAAPAPRRRGSIAAAGRVRGDGLASIAFSDYTQGGEG